jgi:CheY-like chemotaxis protein
MISDNESQQSKEKAMTKVSAQFIHDIATPLAVIQILASNLEVYLPDLLSAYKELKNQGKDVIDITPEDFELLEISTARIKNLTQHINTTTKVYWQQMEEIISVTNETESIKFFKPAPTSLLKSHLNVLVVEDDAIHQKIAYKLLTVQNHVDIAANGHEAIEACRKKNYDLILMDLHMPVMGGQEAAAEIMNLTNPVPTIIGLTNRPLGSEKKQLLAQGFNGFIEKPLNLEELKKLLREFGLAIN